MTFWEVFIVGFACLLLLFLVFIFLQDICKDICFMCESHSAKVPQDTRRHGKNKNCCMGRLPPKEVKSFMNPIDSLANRPSEGVLLASDQKNYSKCIISNPKLDTVIDVHQRTLSWLSNMTRMFRNESGECSELRVSLVRENCNMVVTISEDGEQRPPSLNPEYAHTL